MVGRCKPSPGSLLVLCGEGFGVSLGWGFSGDWRPTRFNLRLRIGEMVPRGLVAKLATVLLGLWFTVSKESSLVSLVFVVLLLGPPAWLCLESTINSSNSESMSLLSDMSERVVIGAGSSS